MVTDLYQPVCPTIVNTYGHVYYNAYYGMSYQDVKLDQCREELERIQAHCYQIKI